MGPQLSFVEKSNEKRDSFPLEKHLAKTPMALLSPFSFQEGAGRLISCVLALLGIHSVVAAENLRLVIVVQIAVVEALMWPDFDEEVLSVVEEAEEELWSHQQNPISQPMKMTMKMTMMRIMMMRRNCLSPQKCPLWMFLSKVLKEALFFDAVFSCPVRCQTHGDKTG